ncbi:hypothetical protein F4778DRAFT_27014 [Xylariomycetidae sp. FL2044]|nr:hypothetical protein F4778DRAFT_27014 [Xylariomycetidae sp. FL2044]
MDRPTSNTSGPLSGHPASSYTVAQTSLPATSSRGSGQDEALAQTAAHSIDRCSGCSTSHSGTMTTPSHQLVCPCSCHVQMPPNHAVFSMASIPTYGYHQQQAQDQLTSFAAAYHAAGPTHGCHVPSSGYHPATGYGNTQGYHTQSYTPSRPYTNGGNNPSAHTTSPDTTDSILQDTRYAGAQFSTASSAVPASGGQDEGSEPLLRYLRQEDDGPWSHEVAAYRSQRYRRRHRRQ